MVAHNEARFLPACLHSLLAQSRVPDEILVVNIPGAEVTQNKIHAPDSSAITTTYRLCNLFVTSYADA